MADELDPPLAISAISRIELENGVYRDKQWSPVLWQSLDVILGQDTTLKFGGAEIEAYRQVLEVLGYSKRKVSYRMTAATAIVHDLTLVTMNGDDFRDVPGLKLEGWPNPAARCRPQRAPRITSSSASSPHSAHRGRL